MFFERHEKFSEKLAPDSEEPTQAEERESEETEEEAQEQIDE